MEVVILTGMSGSGKSKAVDYLEDMGYFCIDNLPPYLLASIIRSFRETGQNGKGQIQKAAFIIDIRSASFFSQINEALEAVDKLNQDYRLIFLDSTDEALLSRYKQTRRIHPLATNSSLSEAIKSERQRLAPLRAVASQIIDTTNFSLNDLRDYMYKLLSPNSDTRMAIIVESFGFKYGVPVDCDIVQDVRFIPNPYYNINLRRLTGRDQAVVEDVFSHEITHNYIEDLTKLLLRTIPYYVKEGKVRLTIGIGCTGGRHRSVAITEEIARRLRDTDLEVKTIHRDIDNDPRNITKQEAYSSGK